jgi:hypothetical protein
MIEAEVALSAEHAVGITDPLERVRVRTAASDGSGKETGTVDPRQLQLLHIHCSGQPLSNSPACVLLDLLHWHEKAMSN